MFGNFVMILFYFGRVAATIGSTIWAVLSGLWFVVIAIILLAYPREQLCTSTKNIPSSRKFEQVSLAIPICGVLVLNQLMINFILSDMGLPTISIDAFGVQWFWSVADLDMTLVSTVLCGDIAGIFATCSICVYATGSLYFMFAAADVIHAFQILLASVKLDCIPGRLASIHCVFNMLGTSGGQCSELCGSLHGFMPSIIFAN